MPLRPMHPRVVLLRLCRKLYSSPFITLYNQLIFPHKRPHILPAADILNAHLSPFLIEQQTSLATALKTVQTSNTALVDTITAQRVEIETLVGGLEAVVADLERSAAMLQGSEVQSLAGEVRMMEDELKA
jgi:kinetochore protein NNF1